MNKHTDFRMLQARSGLVSVLAVLSVTPALAYVDPGTGSMLLQMALAVIAGAMFYFRQFRMVAFDWFRRTVLRQKSVAPDRDTKPLASDLTD